MHTRPRQSIGTGHQQVHAAVPHCAFPRKCGLVHSLEPPSSGLGRVNCRALPAAMSLTPVWEQDLEQSVSTADPGRFASRSSNCGQTLRATRLPHTECHSPMAAGIKSVFQGKLCFPPLPSTVFYRAISSFTKCIRALSALPSLHSLLQGHWCPQPHLQHCKWH